MKKYLLGLAAVVFALSLSAFTGEYKEVKVTKAGLHWFEPPYGPGDYITSTPTVAARLLDSECEEQIAAECERAYTDGQLLTTDPQDGVDPNKLSNPFKIIYLEQ